MQFYEGYNDTIDTRLGPNGLLERYVGAKLKIDWFWLELRKFIRKIECWLLKIRSRVKLKIYVLIAFDGFKMLQWFSKTKGNVKALIISVQRNTLHTYKEIKRITWYLLYPKGS